MTAITPAALPSVAILSVAATAARLMTPTVWIASADLARAR
ncbi:MAG: hypothetical protein ACMG6S_19300 [Byssovorax sp.]